MGIWVPDVALLSVVSKREPEQPGDLTRAIAEELRATMGRRKMSASELAVRSGVGRRSLARYLDAERTFSLEVLDRLAKTLGTTGAEVVLAARLSHQHQSSDSA